MLHKRSILICILLVAITFALYWPTRSFDFINLDDDNYVTRNPVVSAGLTWDGVKWAFNTHFASNWHPLTWISHMLDCQLFGLKPGAHHLTNALFHALNAALLFLVLFRMTGAMWRSCLVAALFALHPAHVESVAWVAERKDVVSTFFGLLTILAYVFYVKEPRRKNSSAIYYCLALLCFALSLLSKPMLVTLPFVLLLLDFWPLGRAQLFFENAGKATSSDAPAQQFGCKALIVEKVPFFLLSCFSCAMTVWAQHGGGAMGMNDGIPLETKAAHVLVSYMRYIGMMFWPSNLAIFYPYTGTTRLGVVLLAFLVLATITLFALSCLRNAPYFSVGWFWFLGTLVPVIGILQVGMQDHADRYTYFPFIGLFIILVWGMAGLWERRPEWRMMLNAGVAILLLVLLVITRRQMSYWNDSKTIFAHATTATKNNYLAHTMLAGALEQEGNYDKAITHLNTALTYNAYYPPTHFFLGMAHIEQGKIDTAIENFTEAARLRPSSYEIRQKLGVALMLKGRLDESLEQFSIAVAINSLDTFSECQIGYISSKKGDFKSAIQHYRNILLYAPANIEVLNNLAWIDAANADPQFRNGTEAVQLAERACLLTHSNEPVLLGTLAAAYAEAGQFTNAVATATRAHDLALAKNQKRVAEKNEQLLRLYRTGRAYHEGRE